MPGELLELFDHVGFGGELLLAAARGFAGLLQMRAVLEEGLDPHQVAVG